MTQRRLALTPRPELENALGRIAAHRGCAKTTVINEFLMDALPVLEAMADAMDLAAKKQDPTNILNALAAMAMSKVGEMGVAMTEFQALTNSNRCPDTLEIGL
jgi:molecular chaperone GrpE (heat shock protein)